MCLLYKFEVLTRHLREDGRIHPNSQCFLTTLNHFQFFVLEVGTVIRSVV